MTPYNFLTQLALVDHTIPDPGNAGTIDPTTSGVCLLVSNAGAETRKLKPPAYVGQVLVLCYDTEGGTSVAVTGRNEADSGNQLFKDGTGTTATFSDVGECLTLIGVKTGTTMLWRTFGSDGPTVA